VRQAGPAAPGHGALGLALSGRGQVSLPCLRIQRRPKRARARLAGALPAEGFEKLVVAAAAAGRVRLIATPPDDERFTPLPS